VRVKRPPEPTEHESQAAFFEWWALFSQVNRLPEQLCFAVPNGGARHVVVAQKLKAEGVKSGVCDVFLLIPAGGFHALLLEFKRRPKKVEPGGRQEAFISETRLRNYNVLVVWSTDEAINAAKAYLARADRPEDRVPMRV
jgi:hypothetical protein